MAADIETVACPVKTLCFEDLRQILAHRFPFLMLDKVLDVVPGKSIVGLKNVTANEIHFVGHFPTVAIMPGALIVEALAQTLHVLDALSRAGGSVQPNSTVKYLGSVNMTFLRPAVPGDQLRLEVEIVKMMRQGVVGNGIARVDGATVAKGQLVLMLKEGPPNE